MKKRDRQKETFKQPSEKSQKNRWGHYGIFANSSTNQSQNLSTDVKRLQELADNIIEYVRQYQQDGQIQPLRNYLAQLEQKELYDLMKDTKYELCRYAIDNEDSKLLRAVFDSVSAHQQRAMVACMSPFIRSFMQRTLQLTQEKYHDCKESKANILRVLLTSSMGNHTHEVVQKEIADYRQDHADNYDLPVCKKLEEKIAEIAKEEEKTQNTKSPNQ